MRLHAILSAAMLCLPALAPAASMTTLPRLQGLPALPAAQAHAAVAYTPGTVLVLASSEAGLGATANGALRAQGALAGVLAAHCLTHATSLRQASNASERGFEALRLTSDDPAFDPVAAAAALRGQNGILAAAPDVHFSLHVTPNDPWYVDQWHLSTSAAGVRAPNAWGLEQGKSSVVIGIMDTGVDLQHSDINAKLWRNPGEILNNGIDDEHDGYIDDYYGYDFGDYDNDPDPDSIIDPVSSIDVGWHGTFVAALAAASSNNATGVAGVAWGCRILPLKVSDVNGSITLTAVSQALDYAIARHIQVLNMSFGTTDPSAADYMQQFVDAALAADIVVVCSAGNDGTDTPTWPAACTGTLAVASTNASNLRSNFSNWGSYVNIAAPGENMWSAIARNYAYDAYSLYYYEQLFGFDGSHAYMSNDGTSFSAPIVSGAAALVRSHYPKLTARQVAQQLIIDGDARLYDNPIGPRLNIERALQQPLAVDPPAVPNSLAFAPVSPDPVTTSARFSFTLAQDGAADLALYDITGRRVATLANGALSAGAHVLAWDGRGSNGARLAPGVYLARLATAGGERTRRLTLLQ